MVDVCRFGTALDGGGWKAEKGELTSPSQRRSSPAYTDHSWSRLSPKNSKT